MADAQVILADLVPVILLLTLGVVAAVASRAVGLSPIVGYIVLGLALSGIGLDLVTYSTMIAMLAELGVVFLLFDRPALLSATSRVADQRRWGTDDARSHHSLPGAIPVRLLIRRSRVCVAAPTQMS